MLTLLLGERRSIENPAVPLSQLDWDHPYYEMLTGGASSSAGLTVSRKTATGYPAFWRGVTLISRDVGRLPFHLYRRLPEGGKKRATEHPSYQPMRWRPCPELAASYFRQLLTLHALVDGNGYAYIYRLGNGDVDPKLGIVPMDSTATFPVRENGRLLYATTVNGEIRKLLPENVLHIKGVGFDGLVGINVVQHFKETLGLGLGARKYGSIYFGNNARPHTVLEHPGKLSLEAKKNLKESWERAHQGLDNAHKTALLEEGVQARVLSDNARQSQLTDVRMFERTEVANILGIPSHMLGDPKPTSYGSLEQTAQDYLNGALDPWLGNWEDEARLKLLTEREQREDTHVFAFVRNALVRADIAARYTAYTTGIQSGFMTRDEVRALEDMNPLPGGVGATPLEPLNMAPAGSQSTESEGGPDDERAVSQEALAAHRQLLVDAFRRMTKRIARHAERESSGPTYDEWINSQMQAQHGRIVAECLGSALRAVATVRPGIDAQAIIAEYWRAITGRLPTTLCPEERERIIADLPERMADIAIVKTDHYAVAKE